MNVRLPLQLAVVLLVVGLPAGAAAGQVAGESKKRVPLDWKRDPKVGSPRAEPVVPTAPELPSELLIVPGGAGPSAEPSRTARPPGQGSDVDGLAMRAGDDMAHEAARLWGWREYWRAGFARGVNVALEDPRLGAWDHEEGMRFGRFDPRARALGDQLANEAAEGTANGDAEARVRQQFMDLSRDPVLDRAGARGRSPQGTVPGLHGPFAVAPIFDEVFVAYPPARTAGLSRDGRRELGDWRFDRSARAYDAQWRDPAFAFSIWRDRQRRGSPWSRWTGAQRDEFRVVFRARFLATLAAIDLRATYGAWRVGFEDGWRYGAAIQAEWAYRQGYAEGFDLGVGETAAIAFPYAYDRAYAAAYPRWFDTWSRSAHPGIGEVRLADESGDGVFEPGERVLVEADVVNYGGGSGAFDLIVSGRDLGPPVTTGVTFAGRSRAPDTERLALRVGDRVPPKTRTPVLVALLDARVETQLYVSRPLDIDGPPAIDADRIGGRVTLTIGVSNTSRRDARAVVSVVSLDGGHDVREDDLGVVPADGRRQATVTFTGIHPLDLIGGTSRWRASVARGDTIDDEREIGIAPVATDLSNPDLLDFMIALANTPQVSWSDVKDARELMMDRLRADWERAVDASGNPYKRDFKSSGTETVLGELVRVTQGGRRSLASPQVFDGLGDDVSVLCDDLPGAHPLLRKWMKKLAKRLG
jgi:hypothetical protein